MVRKATLASVLAKAAVGIRFNEHMEFDDGEVVFYHACKLGLEGIFSKRKDSTYRSGRSPDWLKMTKPACEAVREAEGDWGIEQVVLIGGECLPVGVSQRRHLRRRQFAYWAKAIEPKNAFYGPPR